MYCARPGTNLSQVVAQLALEHIERAPACNANRSQVADVEHDRIGPARLVLGDGAAGVRKWHSPAPEPDHLRPEGQVRGLERRVLLEPGGLARLGGGGLGSGHGPGA